MNDSFFGDNDEFTGSQIMSQGGGFLNDSTMSDMGGMGSGMTPAKSRLVPNDPALLPCTIKQIKNAPTPAQDDLFYIDGRDVAKDNVTIVGRIVGINQESTFNNFTIEDGTGTMEVRFWSAADSQTHEFSDLTENTYVRCIGKVKNYKDTRSMTGFHIRAIEDFHELTYHKLDVIHTHYINTMPQHVKNGLKGQKLNFGNSNNNSNNNSNSNSNNNNSNNNSNSNSNRNNGNFNNFNSNNGNIAGMSNNNNNNNNNASMLVDDDGMDHPPLHLKILNFLRNATAGSTDDTDGCHVDRIFTALANEDRNQIREALEQMSTDGTIFSTVDDETYNVSR